MTRISKPQELHVAFWDAVCEFTKSCGGDTGGVTHNNYERMDAVVQVEQALEALIDFNRTEQASDTADRIKAGFSK